jgi:HSP20 family molecular chaperone IbpA
VAKDTGLPSADAVDDFQRVRRQQVFGRLARWLRREPDDVDVMLPFDEVIAALGWQGERYLGVQTVPIDAIVGSVDRTREFDRSFRPTTNRARSRWQRIDEAQRRGASMPPIDVYKVGDLYFVKDGHHRVSVAAALGYDVIEAHVTEIKTRIPPDGIDTAGDLVTKDYERIFRARVPLPAEVAAQIHVSNPWSYAELAENVEAWGFRLIQDTGRYISRTETARRWFKDEYEPVVTMMKEADLIGSGTEADGYLRLARDRYRLIRAHEWNEEIIARLRH